MILSAQLEVPAARVCVCACVRVRACVCVYVRACVRACTRSQYVIHRTTVQKKKRMIPLSIVNVRNRTDMETGGKTDRHR